MKGQGSKQSERRNRGGGQSNRQPTSEAGWQAVPNEVNLPFSRAGTEVGARK